MVGRRAEKGAKIAAVLDLFLSENLTLCAQRALKACWIVFLPSIFAEQLALRAAGSWNCYNCAYFLLRRLGWNWVCSLRFTSDIYLTCCLCRGLLKDLMRVVMSQWERWHWCFLTSPSRWRAPDPLPVWRTEAGRSEKNKKIVLIFPLQPPRESCMWKLTPALSLHFLRLLIVYVCLYDSRLLRVCLSSRCVC